MIRNKLIAFSFSILATAAQAVGTGVYKDYICGSQSAGWPFIQVPTSCTAGTQCTPPVIWNGPEAYPYNFTVYEIIVAEIGGTPINAQVPLEVPYLPYATAVNNPLTCQDPNKPGYDCLRMVPHSPVSGISPSGDGILHETGADNEIGLNESLWFMVPGLDYNPGHGSFYLQFDRARIGTELVRFRITCSDDQGDNYNYYQDFIVKVTQ